MPTNLSASRVPSIDVDTFIWNPKSGEICAIAEPDCKRDVSNDRFAILMFVKPLPSPTKREPDAITISLPVTFIPPVTKREPENILTEVLISNPLSGEITACTEPDSILSNFRSVSDSAGMLNRPEPSPSYLDAVIGTLTSNLSGSIIAAAEPELILSSSRFSNASSGMLNRPPPSPWNKDAVIEPVIETEPVNCEPICEPVALVVTIN